MGLCKGSGEEGVCVWTGGEPVRSSADGGRWHLPHLSGELSHPPPILAALPAFFKSQHAITSTVVLSFLCALPLVCTLIALMLAISYCEALPATFMRMVDLLRSRHGYRRRIP